jgi:hypothetical protein
MMCLAGCVMLKRSHEKRSAWLNHPCEPDCVVHTRHVGVAWG